jgi:hypothetical protein
MHVWPVVMGLDQALQIGRTSACVARACQAAERGRRIDDPRPFRETGDAVTDRKYTTQPASSRPSPSDGACSVDLFVAAKGGAVWPRQEDGGLFAQNVMAVTPAK